MTRLKNKKCLITGSARGIGLAIAEAFKKEGATIFMSDKNIAEGKAVARQLGCIFIDLNVAQESQWQSAINETGSLDILVNNAGITGFEPDFQGRQQDPENGNLDDWHAVHATNLDGTFLGCKYAIKAMRANRAGAIINISSRSGMVGVPAAAGYASSKAAIRNHTKTVALYCAQQGLDIRCNSIHPAAIMTPMWEPILGTGPEHAASMAAMVKDTPLKRFGESDEVAKLAILLASDEASYMTGSEFTIDGGLLAGSTATPGD